MPDTACRPTAAVVGSCNIPALGECHEYTGSAWTADGIKPSCDSFVVGPCKRDKVFAHCTQRCGAPEEKVVFYDEGAAAGANLRCAAAGGAYVLGP